ncbi:MAG TPA: hypothetical protein VGU65_10940 [Frateuria sp.]|uniref:hypothetical protein n=1 Tax=Frateuria sp. TaxID=2211372 RepID=UPI002DE72D89|nr:hypothetical protein [Frateuria sp.]
MSLNVNYLYHYFYHWDERHAAPSLEILRAFVGGIETDIANSIVEFQRAEFETEVIEVDDEIPPLVVSFFHGLDDASWDLDELFLKHYPSMRRSSTLLIIVASLEDEVNLLCHNAKRHRKYEISFQDLTGNGLHRAVDYLTKVCGLQGIKQADSWSELMRICQLRNKIAHAGGKIKKGDAILSYIDSRADLSTASIYRLYEDTRINLEKGYLEHVLGTIAVFYRHLGDCIRTVKWD